MVDVGVLGAEVCCCCCVCGGVVLVPVGLPDSKVGLSPPLPFEALDLDEDRPDGVGVL